MGQPSIPALPVIDIPQILSGECRKIKQESCRLKEDLGIAGPSMPLSGRAIGGYMQLEVGLAGVDMSRVVIGYEPVWSIGPGKKPADKEYITMVARYIKELTGGADVVYGGGLKTENASMIASIPEIDGGLIALTRFSGQIGFYPEEYLEITELYLGK